MHLYYFLAVVISLLCGSIPAGEVDALRAVVASLGMVLAWVLLSHVSARVVSNQVLRGEIRADVGMRWLDKQLDAFRWIGLGVVLLCLAGFGLAGSAQTWPIVGSSTMLQSAILLTPVTIILMGTWSAENRYGVRLGYSKPGIGIHIRSVWVSFRSGLSWLAVPVLVLMGINDLLSMLPLGETSSAWLSTIGVLSITVLVVPTMIRRLFMTEPFEEPIHSWIHQLISEAGLAGTKAIRWNTDNQNFNAMVAGFIPRIRTMLITDRLINELPRQQVAMVILHEIAHLRRKHVPIRMLSLIPVWAGAIGMTRMAGDAIWAVPLGTGMGIALTLVMLRFVAYRTEHDADVVACQIATSLDGRIEDVPSTYQSASECLSTALMTVTREQPSARKATWLHPSVAQRIEWLNSKSEVQPTTPSFTILGESQA